MYNQVLVQPWRTVLPNEQYDSNALAIEYQCEVHEHLQNQGRVRLVRIEGGHPVSL